MQVRKLGIKALQPGNIYVAYSAKNKLLSKNGKKGVLVKLVETSGVNIKVQPLGTDTTTAITKLESRDDAWIYDVAGADVQVCARVANKNAYPGFSARMEREGWDGKAFTFDPAELYTLTPEDGEENGVQEHVGTVTLRHEGDTIDPDEDAPYVNIFLASDLYPVQEPEWRVPRAQRMGVGAVEINLPPKRVSAEDAELINLLSDALKTFKAGFKPGATASYCVADDKGQVFYDDWQGACHAGLQRIEGRGDKGKAAYILTGCREATGKSGLTGEVLKTFINYLTGYSPFADAFLIKDAEWIMANNCYVLTADVSAQMVAGACIATRQCWEYPHIQVAWYGLMNQGLDANTAYLFGNRASSSGNKWRFAQGATGHTVFSIERMSEKAIIAFIDGKPRQQNKKPYRQDCNYHGVNALWGDTDSKAKVIEKLDTIGGAKTAWGSSGLPFDDAMEQAADIIDDWAKGAGV